MSIQRIKKVNILECFQSDKKNHCFLRQHVLTQSVHSSVCRSPVTHLFCQVIANHSKQQERQRLDDTTELERREEDTQEEVEDEEEEEEDEEEVEDDDNVEEVDEENRLGEGYLTSPEMPFAPQISPYPDGRLVKSHSEAPIGSPKG